MAVLTFKSQEFNTFPPIMKEYASYVNVIKGNSEKTICEYLLDLRTFFIFYIMKKRGEQLDTREFEKIDISCIGLEDVRAITPQNILDFLMYASFERENTPSTRMRKLSALKSFYHYLYGKKNLVVHIEVFPSKISYKEDYQEMLQDISNEISGAVLDFTVSVGDV